VAIGAEQWYSSGTFWAAASVVVMLVGVVATVLVNWVPRQRLYYRAPPPTPLLAPSTRDIPDLEIHHEGQPLTDPYLLEVMLTARGRRDILRSAFDQDQPLVFDLGAGIVKVLQIRCSPTISPAPPVAHEGRTLRVGPALISRRQTTSIAVLVNGTDPDLKCTQAALAQVTLIPRDPPDGSTWVPSVAVAVVVMMMAWALAVTLAVAGAVVRVGALAGVPTGGLAGVAACVVMKWWARRRDVPVD
jgi:hypothetical protein